MRFDFCFDVLLERKRPENGDIPQQRDLRIRDGHAVSHETADDDRLLILHDQLRLGRALGERNDAERPDGLLTRHVTDLFGHLETNLVGVV